MYFNQMFFLLPTIRDHATCSNYTSMQDEYEDDDDGNDREEDTSICAPRNTSVLWSQKWKNKNAMQTTNYEEHLLDFLKERRSEDTDDDQKY
jgi:hypothetical protein